MSIGYSDKSLIEKLGYKPGQEVLFYEAPTWFIDYVEQNGVVRGIGGTVDWAHGFFTRKDEIAIFDEFITAHDIKNGFWVSWPKKSSGVKTDITEQTFRDLILPLGWVDVKVAAIDDTWSGLLFYRRKN